MMNLSLFIGGKKGKINVAKVERKRQSNTVQPSVLHILMVSVEKEQEKNRFDVGKETSFCVNPLTLTLSENTCLLLFAQFHIKST